MISIRRTFAVAMAMAVLVIVVPSAGAGVPPGIGIAATCNPVTGEYDLTFTLTNQVDDHGDLAVTQYEVDDTDPPGPTFLPNPIVNLGVSTASDSVPGTTQYVFIRVQINYDPNVIEDDGEANLAGDCVGTATTTTTSSTTTTTTTTSPSSTTSVQVPSPSAQPVAATPTFTG